MGDAFHAHVELLQRFVAHRGAIVEQIQGLLNAQRKPPAYLQDGRALWRHFEDCFFTLDGLGASQSRLRGQLEAAHWTHGFKPRELPGLHNGLIDPAEMMVRGFYLWQQTRWPGRAGRLRYAHTLFNLYVIRCLQLLSMRVWDAGSDTAIDRLSQVQAVLARLWHGSPGDQPVFVRDARWLVPLAQSPATDDLGAYFDVAEQIAALPDADRLEMHRAGVLLAAGHLRSQTRYYALKHTVPLDDRALLVSTRGSNALDFALLVQDLVPLLDVYERAVRSDDRQTRLILADAICQGISPDPDLFVNRPGLLRAHTMIEQLFVTTDGEGQPVYSAMGRRHVGLLDDYTARLHRLLTTLAADCLQFRPVAGAYSPYGVMYGFASDLLEHMALKATQPDAVGGLGLEDVFASGGGDKLAWVNGWRSLPHLAPELVRQFQYPQRFAEEMFERLERSLHRGAEGKASRADRTGRLFILTGNGQRTDAAGPPAPELSIDYIGSSDALAVAAHKAHPVSEAQLSDDRREGRCVLSYQTPGGSVAISKAMLTDVLGAGRDVTIAGLPAKAAGALKLMCCKLVGDPGDDHDSQER
jgi:hypothetical protein